MLCLLTDLVLDIFITLYVFEKDLHKHLPKPEEAPVIIIDFFYSLFKSLLLLLTFKSLAILSKQLTNWVGVSPFCSEATA